MKVIHTLAVSLVAVSLNAGAADNPSDPDFVVEELDSAGTAHHYRPSADSPITVPVEGWLCMAQAPTNDYPGAVWACLPHQSKAGAILECRAGEHATMTLTDGGSPAKHSRISIDWRRKKS
jgi:hypothetical protein